MSGTRKAAALPNISAATSSCSKVCGSIKWSLPSAIHSNVSQAVVRTAWLTSRVCHSQAGQRAHQFCNGKFSSVERASKAFITDCYGNGTQGLVSRGDLHCCTGTDTAAPQGALALPCLKAAASRKAWSELADPAAPSTCKLDTAVK